ncbi:hypothetical protein K431DRAFT_221785 [Polychaeton citri CBS 116435]|uniref:TPR-like protein n=1 Tax=Polychaeton citri CBS 116435 TaxID=1314669 RepID=A0A9P4URZ9_9PEZI|nr:hypothetical protein K431DRAFT_221785 [Polychaeton citri CBS 116435]
MKSKPSRQDKQSQKDSNTAKKMANGTGNKPTESPEQVYASIEDLMQQGLYEDALSQAEKLWKLVENGSITAQLPALNLLGEISVEIGDVDTARTYFEKAVTLDPEGKVPETMGGGAEKFLWLAQLCEEGGKQSVEWFEQGIRSLQHEIAALEAGQLPNLQGLSEEELLLLRVEKKRKLANALCGIVEVYMTDLSWENDAEARCESLITEAMTVEDEPNPEVLQTVASVRLSQQRLEDAQSALRRSMDGWKDLDPEDADVPDFPTRISLSRLLMEAEMETQAFDVLSRLVLEDDQSVEAWYLGGWCQYLTAQRAHEDGKMSEAEVAAWLKGSRHWLSVCLKLYRVLEYEDERLKDHASELLSGMRGPLSDEELLAEAEEEEWEGISDGGDGDGEPEDAEMQDS